jgi:ATP-binding protein involved in chromosome partitioning
MGTAKFLVYMTAFIILWIAWNTLATNGPEVRQVRLHLPHPHAQHAGVVCPRPDPALRSRQADRDRVALEQDRARDERNLADTEYLTREVASLRIALRDMATRDFVRSELRSMLDEMEQRGMKLKTHGKTSGSGEKPPAATGGPKTDLALSHARSVAGCPVRRPHQGHRPRDPQAHTELGMVESVDVDEAGLASVTILLTVSGCPLKETLTKDTTAALLTVEGVTSVNVTLGVMTDEQRTELRTNLRGGTSEPEIPFAKAGSLTRVYCVASGKGGVGKSSVTVNLAVAMAQEGLRVGVVDADVYGFSVPRMLGTEQRPTQVDDMILPPISHDVKVISIGMFVPGNQPVVWRGPMLHRALQQFLGDVFWGDLDVLLLDLPPGTGDIAISVAQLIPTAEILIVTTPQKAAAEVAERAGSIALQTHQRIAGVIENMSWLELPDGSRQEIFGSGGGQVVADSLTKLIGALRSPCWARSRSTRCLREGGDAGMPVVLGEPNSPAAVVLRGIARGLSTRSRGLSGRSLGLTSRRSIDATRAWWTNPADRRDGFKIRIAPRSSARSRPGQTAWAWPGHSAA